jgi:hypothetical protein
MSMQAIELIQTVADDELNDGLQLVRAGLEDQAGKQIVTMPQYQIANQFIDEGLGGLHAREVQYHFVAVCEQQIKLLAQGARGKSRPKKNAGLWIFLSGTWMYA